MSLRLSLFLFFSLAAFSWAEVYQPKEAPKGEYYPLQGEYEGTMHEKPFAMQVLVNEAGVDAVICPGGLPGKAPLEAAAERRRISSIIQEGEIRFSGNGWRAALNKEGIVINDFKGDVIGELKRMERSSATLGAPPPDNAVVLFDGSNVDSFQKGARLTEDKLLAEGCTSIEEFGDCSIHLEFCLPYLPKEYGQSRGNSGLLIAGRYELQILDSFGANGDSGDCGAVYGLVRPKVNMSYPALTWQTYDVDYTAPRFDEKKQKISDALLTVKHNNVIIHDKVKLTGPTRSVPQNKEMPRGPIVLQAQRKTVLFRNFWATKK
jgi:hypothetical protein